MLTVGGAGVVFVLLDDAESTNANARASEFRYRRWRRWQPSLESRPTSEARPAGDEAGGPGSLESNGRRNTRGEGDGEGADECADAPSAVGGVERVLTRSLSWRCPVARMFGVAIGGRRGRGGASGAGCGGWARRAPADRQLEYVVLERGSRNRLLSGQERPLPDRGRLRTAPSGREPICGLGWLKAISRPWLSCSPAAGSCYSALHQIDGSGASGRSDHL